LEQETQPNFRRKQIEETKMLKSSKKSGRGTFITAVIGVTLSLSLGAFARPKASQVTKMSSAKTVNGQSLAISVNGGTVMVDNAKVIKTDILCSNGVIHVIDSVVLPK
jgi:uncharacterized surface protein with fasciclin (FAS1) repeats